MPTIDTDRLERHLDMNAPPSRVWRALADPTEFGSWFGLDLDGAFVPGQTTTGRMTDEGWTHLTASFFVDAVEPETRLVFRWHPYAIDPAVDYSAEPPTTVTITVAPHGTGTRVTVVEAGFDAIPAHRRAEALQMNTGGWEAQLRNVAEHVGG